MKIFTPYEAVKETNRLLKNEGFQFLQKSAESYYLIRRKCKVRVSTHHRPNTSDCDIEIVYLDCTIMSDIEYRVSKCSTSK